MRLELLWVIGLLAFPAVCSLPPGKIATERMLRLHFIASIGMLICSALVFVVPVLREFRLSLPGITETGLARALFRIDPLSQVLPLLAATLWLFSIAVTPRMLMGPGGLRRTALATLFTSIAFLTENPLLLFATWVGSVLTFSATLAEGRHRHRGRLYLAASTVCFGAGLVFVFWPGTKGGTGEIIGLIFLSIGALMRKGIFPFHGWVPAVFEHGRLGPAILFCAPQLGTYMMAILIVPRAPVWLLHSIGVLALLTSVYAAALALIQSSARRAVAYLFLSQSALVVAGLGFPEHEPLAGALLLWLSSSLAFAGLARCVLVLEARRGSLDLSLYHGGYERKPLLAVTFLLLGLTCTGFPATVGFVGEELLLSGVGQFPILGILVFSSALTGLAVLRMYFSLFCGTTSDALRLDLRPREAIGFAGVVLPLLLFGVIPAPLVASRLEASSRILASRPGQTVTTPAVPD